MNCFISFYFIIKYYLAGVANMVSLNKCTSSFVNFNFDLSNLFCASTNTHSCSKMMTIVVTWFKTSWIINLALYWLNLRGNIVLI